MESKFEKQEPPQAPLTVSCTMQFNLDELTMIYQMLRMDQHVRGIVVEALAGEVNGIEQREEEVGALKGKFRTMIEAVRAQQMKVLKSRADKQVEDLAEKLKNHPGQVMEVEEGANP
jgi:hypothetical protein